MDVPMSGRVSRRVPARTEGMLPAVASFGRISADPEPMPLRPAIDCTPPLHCSSGNDCGLRRNLGRHEGAPASLAADLAAPSSCAIFAPAVPPSGTWDDPSSPPCNELLAKACCTRVRQSARWWPPLRRQGYPRRRRSIATRNGLRQFRRGMQRTSPAATSSCMSSASRRPLSSSCFHAAAARYSSEHLAAGTRK